MSKCNVRYYVGDTPVLTWELRSTVTNALEDASSQVATFYPPGRPSQIHPGPILNPSVGKYEIHDFVVDRPGEWRVHVAATMLNGAISSAVFDFEIMAVIP